MKTYQVNKEGYYGEFGGAPLKITAQGHLCFLRK